MRGSEIKYSPLFKSYLHLKVKDSDPSILYTYSELFTTEIKDYLTNIFKGKIEMKNYKEIFNDLKQYKKTVAILPQGASTKIYLSIP